MTSSRFVALLVLLFAVASFSTTLHAEDAPVTPAPKDEAKKAPEKLTKVMRPFLWRVEGGTPCYLFGTVHVADPRVIAMHPLSIEAFEKADVTGFEIDMVKDVEAQLEAMKLPEGEVFEELVPAELIARLDARLKKISPIASLKSLGAAGIKNLRPGVWGLLLGSLEEELKNMGKPFLDAQLQLDARKKGKAVVAMEIPAEQLQVFSKLTNEEQVIFLEATLDGMDKADKKGENINDKTVELYLTGDEAGLLKMATEMLVPEGKVTQELIDKVWSEFSYKRNERMAKKFIELRKANPETRYFIAVGTMHLAGEKNIQHYLKEAGITTTRVTDSLEPAKKAESKPEPAGAK